MTATHTSLDLLLKKLKLTSILQNYAQFATIAGKENQSYELYLKALIEEEMNCRDTNRIKRLITQAKFDRIKRLHEFDFTEVPALNKQKIIQLSDGHFIDRAENVCLLGPAGVGKSHLAKSIGYEACKKGYPVRFFSAAELVNELIESKQNYILSKIQKRYRKYKLILLDELGYIPFSKEGAELLFQFFADMYEKTSIIVTTNLEFSEWVSFLGDPAMTSALLDRFTHHCHIFSIEAESFRFKEKQTNG